MAHSLPNPRLWLLNFTGKTETDLDSFCTGTRGFQEQVEVVYQKGKKKPLVMTQCVKNLLSDSMVINQGCLPALKKPFLSQLLRILNLKYPPSLAYLCFEDLL